MRTWRERDPLSALAAMATSGMDGAFYACLRLCWLECAVALGICIIVRVVILGDGILFLAKQTVRVPSRQRRDAHGAADRHLRKPSRGEPDDGGDGIMRPWDVGMMTGRARISQPHPDVWRSGAFTSTRTKYTDFNGE